VATSDGMLTYFNTNQENHSNSSQYLFFGQKRFTRPNINALIETLTFDASNLTKYKRWLLMMVCLLILIPINKIIAIHHNIIIFGKKSLQDQTSML
jgi:hypothetical protein